MTQETAGHVKKVKGKVKEAVGIVTGNRKLEKEGALQRAEGAVQATTGKALRKMGDALEDVADAIRK